MNGTINFSGEVWTLACSEQEHFLMINIPWKHKEKKLCFDMYRHGAWKLQILTNETFSTSKGYKKTDIRKLLC